MPHLRPFPILAALVLALSACSHEAADTPAAPAPATVAATDPGATEGTPGQSEVALAMMAGHRLSATDELTFVGAVDTRCPSGQDCIRASEAYALFLVQSSDQPAVLLTLPLDSSSQDQPSLRQRSARGYRFHLLSLDPAPAMGTQVTNEDYVARLRIEADPSPGPQAVDPQAQLLEYGMPAAGSAPAGREEIPGFQGWASTTLGLHDSVDLSDTAALTLAGVIESRCPSQAACIAAGQAHVLFLVTAEGQPAQALALQWSAQFRDDPASRWKWAAGHRVFLESIDPDPEVAAITPAVSYQATLRIEGLAPTSGSSADNIR